MDADARVRPPGLAGGPPWGPTVASASGQNASMTVTDAPRLDHLVVAAPTLDGGRWIVDTLGVLPQPGGRHEAFGTHNALVSLGDCYLEVIAIDPEAGEPGRPRWFDLDRLELAGPRLIHWVVAVGELAPAPDVLDLSRGDNRWRLTVPLDGSLPEGGVAPSLIEWLTPPPALRLPDAGARLVRLELSAPDPDALEARLSELAFADSRVVVGTGPVGLRATVRVGGREVSF